MSDIVYRRFTREEDAYLMRAWQTGVQTEIIAARLDRNKRAIENRAFVLRVRRPAWFTIEARRRAQRVGNAIRFGLRAAEEDRPPGHKMSEDKIAALYAGRRYADAEVADGKVGRMPLPPVLISAASSLVGAV